MRLCCPVGKHGPVLPFAPTAEDEKGTELRQTARATTPGPAGPGRERRCRTRAWKPRSRKAMARERRSRAMWLNSFGGLQG